MRPVQNNPAELAANEETGERLSPDTDMPAAEEGVEERTLAKLRLLKGLDQPTAAEIEQHEAQGHLPFRRWCPQCVSGRGVGQ
eukprot:3959076-Amphidinium_carterae.2